MSLLGILRHLRLNLLRTKLLLPPNTSKPVCSSFGFQLHLSKRQLCLPVTQGKKKSGLTMNPLFFYTQYLICQKIPLSLPSEYTQNLTTAPSLHS